MIDEQIDNLVNNLLTFMHLCEDDRGKIAVSIKSMDGAIPTMGDIRSPREHKFLIPRNDGRPAIWPIDTKTIIASDGLNFAPEDRWPPGTMQFHRTRTITTKDARRLAASRFSSLMVMDEMVAAMPDGTTKSGGGPYAFHGGEWVPAAPLSIRYPENRGKVIQTSLGWALAVRYEWTIWLGYTAGPRIRFLSDPTGAREAFRLRDIPEGRVRRAALRNWVSSHWRQNRDDEENSSWVKKHLRGAVDFTWNGLRCKIQPPDFDIEELSKSGVP